MFALRRELEIVGRNLFTLLIRMKFLLLQFLLNPKSFIVFLLISRAENITPNG